MEIFDTLKYTKKLEDTGYSRQQAEAQIGVIQELMENSFATKTDLKAVEDRLSTKIDLLSRDLTIKMGWMIGAGVGFLTALTTTLAAVLKFLT